MDITQVGIDLAKCRVAQAVKPLKRSQVAESFAQLASCLNGMEACGGSHFWACKLMELGQQIKQVKLIAPQFVKP